MENRDDERNFHFSSHMVMGLLVIFLGVLFLLGNLERLERIELMTRDSRIAILSTGKRLPVSKSGYSRLKPLL